MQRQHMLKNVPVLSFLVFEIKNTKSSILVGTNCTEYFRESVSIYLMQIILYYKQFLNFTVDCVLPFLCVHAHL